MAELASTSVQLLGGKVVLSKREESPYWQSRFRIGNKWVRTSTKTKKLKEAKDIATKQYAVATVKAENNIPVVTRRFRSVAEAVRARLQKELDAGIGPVMNKDYDNAIKNYHIPFFGNHNIASIDHKLIRQFNDWRVAKLKREPAKSTITCHARALRLVFSEAVTQGYMTEAQVPTMHVMKAKANGKETERRPDFTLDEWRHLYRFMRTWVKKGRKGKSTDMRYLLRELVLILGNSGIRWSTEALSMRWNRITEHQDGDKRALSVWVKGKTVGGYAVLRPGCRRFLERIKERTEALKDLTWEETLKQDLPIIALPDGTVPAGLHKTFKTLMDDSGLLICPRTKQARTLYCLRHFYITQQLVSRKMTPILVAKQCRTSVGMLERHYFHLDVIQHWQELSQ